MHTLSLLCSMSRLPHLTVCLVGALLLMPVCRAEEREDDFEEGYATTEDYDYNATFDYVFFSNSSTDELDKFLLAAGDTGDVEVDTDITPTEDVTEEEQEEQESVDEEETVEEVTITRPPTSHHIPKDEACRTTSPSLLITLGLISHQLARLL